VTVGSLFGSLAIPTSSLAYGQTYYVYVSPLFNNSFSANLVVVLKFVVGYPTLDTITTGNTAQATTSTTSGSPTTFSSISQANVSYVFTSSYTGCISPAEPLGFYLGIYSNNSANPIRGANVNATHYIPVPSCGTGGSSSKTITINYSFITSGYQWYSFDTINGGSYDFKVYYSGQTYEFNVTLGYSVYTCATLNIPSGFTNIITSQSSCQY